MSDLAATNEYTRFMIEKFNERVVVACKERHR